VYSKRFVLDEIIGSRLVNDLYSAKRRFTIIVQLSVEKYDYYENGGRGFVRSCVQRGRLQIARLG